jgi:hypothetical protein
MEQPMKIKDLNELQDWMQGVFCGRPGDSYPRIRHAGGVTQNVVLALTGAVIAVADPGSIEIMERKGRLSNIAWFEVQGRRHALAYRDGAVHLHQRSKWGQLVEIFNCTNTDRIWPVFSTL